MADTPRRTTSAVPTIAAALCAHAGTDSSFEGNRFLNVQISAVTLD